MTLGRTIGRIRNWLMPAADPLVEFAECLVDIPSDMQFVIVHLTRPPSFSRARRIAMRAGWGSIKLYDDGRVELRR